MSRPDPRLFSWRIVLPLAAGIGVLYSSLTISGWINAMEGWVALALIGAMSVVVVWMVPQRPVRNGFFAGFLAALIAIELQALFLPLYFSNNPGYADIDIPFGLSARLATALFAPLNAVLAGVLTAGCSWLACRLTGQA